MLTFLSAEQTLDSSCRRRCDLKGVNHCGDVEMDVFNVSLPSSVAAANGIALSSPVRAHTVVTHYNSLAVSVMCAQSLTLPSVPGFRVIEEDCRPFVSMQVVTGTGGRVVLSRGESGEATVPGASPLWTASRDTQVVLPFPNTVVGTGTVKSRCGCVRRHVRRGSLPVALDCVALSPRPCHLCERRGFVALSLRGCVLHARNCA